MISLENKNVSWIHFDMRHTKINKFLSCIFFGDYIQFDFYVDDKTFEQLERILFLSNTDYDKNSKYKNKMVLSIKNKKEMDMLMPILQDKFKNSEYLSNTYIETFNNFFDGK